MFGIRMLVCCQEARGILMVHYTSVLFALQLWPTSTRGAHTFPLALTSLHLHTENGWGFFRALTQKSWHPNFKVTLIAAFGWLRLWLPI